MPASVEIQTDLTTPVQFDLSKQDENQKALDQMQTSLKELNEEFASYRTERIKNERSFVFFFLFDTKYIYLFYLVTLDLN